MPQCDAHYITQKNKNQSKYLCEITPSELLHKNINNYNQGGKTHDTHKNTKRTGCVPRSGPGRRRHLCRPRQGTQKAGNYRHNQTIGQRVYFLLCL